MIPKKLLASTGSQEEAFVRDSTFIDVNRATSIDISVPEFEVGDFFIAFITSFIDRDDAQIVEHDGWDLIEYVETPTTRNYLFLRRAGTNNDGVFVFNGRTASIGVIISASCRFVYKTPLGISTVNGLQNPGLFESSNFDSSFFQDPSSLNRIGEYISIFTSSRRPGGNFINLSNELTVLEETELGNSNSRLHKITVLETTTVGDVEPRTVGIEGFDGSDELVSIGIFLTNHELPADAVEFSVLAIQDPDPKTFTTNSPLEVESDLVVLESTFDDVIVTPQVSPSGVQIEYSKNDGPFTSQPSVCQNGDTFRIKLSLPRPPGLTSPPSIPQIVAEGKLVFEAIVDGQTDRFAESEFLVTAKRYFLFSASNTTTTFTVPDDVTSANILVIGHGGIAGSVDAALQGAGGGGGGALSFTPNVPLTPGETLTIQMAPTPTRNSSVSRINAVLRGSTILVSAEAGFTGGNSPHVDNPAGIPPLSGGMGGRASQGVGAVRYSGGTGGSGVDIPGNSWGSSGAAAGYSADGANGRDANGSITLDGLPGNGGGGGSARTVRIHYSGGTAPWGQGINGEGGVSTAQEGAQGSSVNDEIVRGFVRSEDGTRGQEYGGGGWSTLNGRGVVRILFN